MLTHLVHFHIRGAQASTAVPQATHGWAQGHFLGAYLGAGAKETSPDLDTFTAGWAQGHALAPYLGAGAGEGTADLDTFTAGWAQGAWLGYYYGAGASAVSDAVTGGGDSRKHRKPITDPYQRIVLQEDEEILEIMAMLASTGLFKQ